jgi:mercuric ion binding protein
MKTLLTGLALTALFGLVAPDLAAQQQVAAAEQGSRQIEVTILGMSCPFCAYGVEQKLKKLEGVENLDVVLETGLATLTLEDGADVSNDLLQKAVKEAGFEVAKIVRNFESQYPVFEREPALK